MNPRQTIGGRMTLVTDTEHGARATATAEGSVDKESAGRYHLRCKKRNDGGGPRSGSGVATLHCSTTDALYRRARHNRSRHGTIERST